MAEMQIEGDTQHAVTFSAGHSAVRVDPFWCGDSEEVKLRISLDGYGDTCAVAVWDGSSLVWEQRSGRPTALEQAAAKVIRLHDAGNLSPSGDSHAINALRAVLQDEAP